MIKAAITPDHKDYAAIISSDNLALGMYLADALAGADGSPVAVPIPG